MLKFTKQSGDSERVKTAEWLLGYSDSRPGGWRFNSWNKSRRRLSSPLNHYLREVYRFSLDRGVEFDLPGLADDDPRQILIDQVFKLNNLEDLLYSAVERGAVAGETYWFYHLDADNYYKVYLYDATEVMPYPEDSGLTGYMVQVPNGSGGYNRWGFTDTRYIEYYSSKNPLSQWKELSSLSHNYGKVPVVCCPNKVKDHSGKGQPTFDWLSLEISLEIGSQMLSSAANYTYFGGPFLVSGDPKNTLKELLNRSQVLTGSNDSQIQNTEALSFPAMPSDHPKYIEQLCKNLASHLGVSWVPDEPPSDTSSITLRLLNSKTINHAEKLGDKYCGQVKYLLEEILLAAAIDQVLVGVTNDPETHTVEHSYQADNFPPTPVEKQQLLSVVEQLQLLGVSPEIALQEYYTDRTTDQIQEMMLGA